MLILPVTTFMICYGVLPHVHITESGAAFVEKRGDPFVFALQIQNDSIFFSNNAVIQLTIGNSLSDCKTTHTLNFPVNPLQSTRIEYPLVSDHCGIITIDAAEIVVYDLLNFFALKKKIAFHHEIPVLPNPLTDDRFADLDLTQGYTNLEESPVKGNDTSEVSDIREYIPGDKLQSIHWKLSAKKDTLMVKDHLSLTSSQLLLYIELAKTTQDLLDKILDYSYGIGMYLVNHQKPFSLLWYNSIQKDFSIYLVLSQSDLNDCIMEVLYQRPIENYREIQELIPKLTGHENYITIGVDYVSK
ncbi:MAG: DUF58 domain-containing protein [Lachnospiraceae bacterium]